MLNSLVRVSRWEKENYLVLIREYLHRTSSQNECKDLQRYSPICSMSDIMLNSQASIEYVKTSTGFLHFSFNSFRYSLTLFSKFFASFPHGTCILLVSHEYLALDEIYHLLGAAIPNNSTRWWILRWWRLQECHPLSCHIPKDFTIPIVYTSLDHNSLHKQWFKLWAFPSSVALTIGIIIIFFSSTELYA